MDKNKKIEFYRPNNLVNNVVLVNGTARCGKSLISPIISSFKNVEIERVEGIFDYIAVSHFFGSIEKSCAINMLRTLVDEYTYSSYLSRDTNFRWKDHSSIFKSPSPFKYIKRLFMDEGVDTVKRIQKEDPIYQNQGHDHMQFVRLHMEAWPNKFKMIEIIRDPIDQVDTWWRRGWGTRFSKDPAAYTPSLKFKDTAVPFYAHGWEEDYLEITPMNRIIKMLYHLQLGNRNAYEALTENEKKQILVIRFEDFILNTYDHVKKIADFLETEETKATKEAIKYQGCPRIQNMDKKIKKFENIKKEASTKYLHLLDEMIEDYKTDWN
jgi:hypothetical protein